MVSTHIPRSFHMSSCPISDVWGSVSHPVGSFSIQGQKLALQGHFSICCTPMAQEGMNIQPWDALSSSTKGHRRTQDYRLRFLSWLLEPGPVIPVLSPVCPWATVIQEYICRKPPLWHNQIQHGVNTYSTVGRWCCSWARQSSANYHPNITWGSKETSVLVFCSRHSSARAWHLGGSLHSLCHCVFCQHDPWQPGWKPAEGEPLKAAQTQPWVY